MMIMIMTHSDENGISLSVHVCVFALTLSLFSMWAGSEYMCHNMLTHPWSRTESRQSEVDLQSACQLGAMYGGVSQKSLFETKSNIVEFNRAGSVAVARLRHSPSSSSFSSRGQCTVFVIVVRLYLWSNNTYAGGKYFHPLFEGLSRIFGAPPGELGLSREN